MRRTGNFFLSVYDFLRKYIIFLFSFIVLVINYSLAFDNVVWGDEAFSGNVIQNTNLFGIYQRIFYWDSHPPLYYYWLRLCSDLFGYNVPVYHVASLIPFSICILLILFPIRKKIGTIPAAFAILICGLSAPCVEYNLEIRMYALLFMEVLICAYCSFRIISNDTKKRFWIGLTIVGVTAAYTHYFGLVTSGILLFVTGLWYFICHKGKTWLYGFVSIFIYLLLYVPWFLVLYKQASSVSGSWWLNEIAPLNTLTTMIFCGNNMKQILIPVIVFLSLFIFLYESNIVCLKLNKSEKAISWHFTKPSIRCWSTELHSIFAFWVAIILTVIFTYIASILINPLTVARYMYPLIPLVLFILMLCIRRLLAYGRVSWGKETFGEIKTEQQDDCISLVDTKSKGWTRGIYILVVIVFCIMLFIGFFDFKDYRSLSKTHNVETEKILTIIGEPEEKAVFTSAGVKHLAWTIFPFYFPDNAYFDKMPNDLEGDANEIWAFLGFVATPELLQQMEDKGYLVIEYQNLWFGKYSCNIYHFYK